MPKWSKIFPTIHKLDDGAVTDQAIECAICGELGHLKWYDLELPAREEAVEPYVHQDNFFCEACKLFICKADVVLRMNGYARPYLSES